MKLTAKQKRFVQEYLIDLNATQAAIRAGYSKKSAHSIGPENLEKPEIKQAIEEKLKQIDEEKTADAKEIREFWTRVMRGEEKDTVLRYDNEGHQVETEINVSMKDRIRASELMGKSFAMFTDKIDSNVDMDLNIEVEYEDKDSSE
ncbi:MAG: terminase small subunit [Absicoccus sp.]|uniref:Terminase small subunit n=1 Tax=Absicoccus intestinalis TaxID=2926319 RepID=A0ABU4WNQ6_9FIRM|nr:MULTISPECIES: terminase small subunit [unclassified Absicoccus]MDX8417909.1 terminase small subunit [Absicoccus sp. CLA-KB-P134]MDY3034864.1 terminase small subunit [Absicoccus sp.]